MRGNLISHNRKMWTILQASLIEFLDLIGSDIQNFILDHFTSILGIPRASSKMLIQTQIAMSKQSHNRNEIFFIVGRGAVKVYFVLFVTLQSNSLPCTHNYSFNISRQRFRVEFVISIINICKSAVINLLLK